MQRGEPRAREQASVVRREGWGRTAQSGPTHANEGFELTWVERGHLWFMAPGRDLEVPAGMCALVPPGVVHTPRAAGVVMHQLTLDRAWVEGAARALGGEARAPREPRLFGALERVTALVRATAQEAAAAGRAEAGPGGAEASADAGPLVEVARVDAGVAALAEATAFVLVRGEATAARRRRDRRVQRVLERMESDLAAPLRVEALAREVGLDRWSFARLFREHTGDTPTGHLTGLRLERAARLLRETRAPVLAIALGCGFPDPSRFARAFRARFGHAPLAFRRLST